MLQLGDLLGVVKITVPDTATRVAINKNRAILIATAIVTVFLAMMAAYVIVRYVIVKPLKHLRDVSDDVTRGNIQARADIQTGDEFEDLAKAFNQMLAPLGRHPGRSCGTPTRASTARSTSWRSSTCGSTK